MLETSKKDAANNVRYEEKCICDLCECGYHRCPHIGTMGNEKTGFGSSEYKSNFGIKEGGVASTMVKPLMDNFKREGELFLNSTHRNDFKAWPTQHVDVVHPIEEIVKPVGEFFSTSTHKADFTRKDTEIEPIKPVKPQSANYWRRGVYEPFTEQSTHKADFDRKFVDPPAPIRPSSVLYKTNDPFVSTTTHKDDYRVFNLAPATSFKPQEQSRHLSDEPFTAITEHRANFDKKTIECVQMCKPEAKAYRPSSQPMETKSTYQIGFTNKFGEKVDPVRQTDQLKVSNNGPFDSTTVYRKEFLAKQLHICPAAMVLSKRDKSFRRFGVRNGHIMYRRVVVASIPDIVRYRNLSPVCG